MFLASSLLIYVRVIWGQVWIPHGLCLGKTSFTLLTPRMFYRRMLIKNVYSLCYDIALWFYSICKIVVLMPESVSPSIDCACGGPHLVLTASPSAW